MRRFVVASAALAALAAGNGALAASPVVAPWSWTGFYLGGNVGYSWGSASTDFNQTTTSTSVVTAMTTGGAPLPGNGATATTTATAFGRADADMNGWLGGIQAGYNWQVQQWVFGLEGDIQATGQKGDALFCGTPGCPAGSAFATSSTKLPWFGTLRGRVGRTFDAGPGRTPILLYITGGMAFGELDATFTSGTLGGTAGSVNVNSTQAGWTIGAGGEGRLGQSDWTLKLEYLYMDLGSVSGAVSGTGAPFVTPFGINNADQIHFITTTTTLAGVASTHVTDNILRVGLNYKFPPR